MNRESPGPPLLMDPEYCPQSDPTAAEYAHAAAMGLLAALGGSAVWFLMVLATGRLWGILSMGMGLLCGWTVHQAAARHRSVGTGVLASAYTALGLGLGHWLLFNPNLLARLVQAPAAVEALRWFDLLFGLGALFIAYRTAGPIRRETPRL